MKKDINKCIQTYKEPLENEYMQEAYITLMRYVAELKAKFSKNYKTGYISFCYLDYTYFPFSNDYLSNNGIRFGIVLNHKKMQFELWLMGRNAEVQKEYWNILKNTKWNKDIDTMPQYLVLEVCIENNIDFDNKEKMTVSILRNAITLSKDIQTYLENNS